jgi:hypothetical protein
METFSSRPKFFLPYHLVGFSGMDVPLRTDQAYRCISPAVHGHVRLLFE